MSLSDSLVSPNPASSLATPITPPPRWFGLAMIAVFALVMPVAFAGNEGEAAVAAVGGAISLGFVVRPRLPAIGVMLLAALAIWAAISFAWSPLLPKLASARRYKDIEALTAPKLLLQAVLYCAFVYGALRLPPAQRDRALWVLASLVGLVAAVLVIEGMEGGRIYGALNRLGGGHLRPDLARRDAGRGCYAVVLLFWPLALATWRKIPPAVPCAVAAALLVSAFCLNADSPVAALVLSSIVFVAARSRPRLTPLVLMVGAAIYFLAAPLVFLPHGQVTAGLAPDVGKESWHIRVSIWRFASLLIAHRPLLGYGLDASRVYPDQIPMHPHDAAIQLWLETGVLGALLAALFWGWLFLRIRALGRADRDWTAAACAAACAYLLIGAISFGVWQEWWLGLGAIVTAICGMVLRQRREAAAVVRVGELAALS